ncbi:MAG: hypothetical protein AAB617_00930 [Patescibacteria group bacterium]
MIKQNNGQVMILSVMLLGGVLLSASAVAGLLTLYQIKSANDAVNSAKALYAADAGVESASWAYFKGDIGNIPVPVFNDTSVSVVIQSSLAPTSINITSKGFAAGNKVIRILETIFENVSP